jgi:hypothetical protein
LVEKETPFLRYPNTASPMWAFTKRTSRRD